MYVCMATCEYDCTHECTHVRKCVCVLQLHMYCLLTIQPIVST